MAFVNYISGKFLSHPVDYLVTLLYVHLYTSFSVQHHVRFIHVVLVPMSC